MAEFLACLELRCCAFWSCLESLEALRFSDHRGLSPNTCSLTEGAFKGMLSRTNTTGPDKKVQSRVLHLDRGWWLLYPEWMPVGWKLWLTTAPQERDFFLPVLTKAPDHREKYECRYSEATVRSQVPEAELTLNKEKLLCTGVPGRLWRVHCPSSFLASCTGCLRYPKWQDAIGGWSPGQSEAYARTSRRRIGITQASRGQVASQARKRAR